MSRYLQAPFQAGLLALLWSSTTLAQEDMEDVLEGFDDLGSYAEVIELAQDNPDDAFADRTWELGGSLAASASYNLREHDSTSGTDYGGLSRLRARVNLSVDGRPSDAWRLRLDLSGWHDFAYALRDADYTPEVLRAYEQDAQVQDAWIAGRLADAWDIKLGRQVAVWGFADNLRVLDLLNPLDNLEPGLADVEDLRRPVGMLRLDHYRGAWQLSGYLVPEQRFSRNPPFGSDFYPLTDSQGNALRYRSVQPEDFSEIGAALALVGRFSGWDLSLNLSRHRHDEPWLDASDFDSSDPNATEEDFAESAVLRHSRVSLVGLGAQLTLGGWLFKQETAWLHGMELTSSSEVEASLPLIGGLPVLGDLVPAPGDGQILPTGGRRVERVDLLLGVEYFGLAGTSIGLEVSARRIIGHAQDLAWSGYLKWRGESALRITRDFLNERLRVHLIGLLLHRDGRAWEASGGALYRAQAEYDLGRGLIASGGVVLYDGGEQLPFTVMARNDRAFTELRWNF